MRSTFRGYYAPNEAEVREIWTSGLIILDTNALLHLFRYSETAREDLFRALEAKQESLWIPFQVGMEFHRQRIGIVNAQDKAFDQIQAALTKARNQAEAALNDYRRHPSLDISPLQAEFTSAIEALTAKLQTAREGHAKKMTETRTNDHILSRITKLYEGRVGEPFSEEELGKIYDEGAERYERKVPPGYKDAETKGDPQKYGDLVLWKQILAKAGSAKRPAIFVTDDQKEDWYYTVDSQRYGARPELVDEYFAVAEAPVHLMTTDRFLGFAKSQLVKISQESVEEAELLSQELAREPMHSDRREREARQEAIDRARAAIQERTNGRGSAASDIDSWPFAAGLLSEYRTIEAELEHATARWVRARSELNSARISAQSADESRLYSQEVADRLERAQAAYVRLERERAQAKAALERVIGAMSDMTDDELLRRQINESRHGRMTTRSLDDGLRAPIRDFPRSTFSDDSEHADARFQDAAAAAEAARIASEVARRSIEQDGEIDRRSD